MISLKPGMRLRSAVSSAEFVVVKAPGDPVDLRCGGHPVTNVATAASEPHAIASGFDGEVLIGKRYTDDAATLEVMVTKAGTGLLSIGDVVLERKDTKPLPASD